MSIPIIIIAVGFLLCFMDFYFHEKFTISKHTASARARVYDSIIASTIVILSTAVFIIPIMVMVVLAYT